VTTIKSEIESLKVGVKEVVNNLPTIEDGDYGYHKFKKDVVEFISSFPNHSLCELYSLIRNELQQKIETHSLDCERQRIGMDCPYLEVYSQCSKHIEKKLKELEK
jgi:hypothetical protein